MPSPEWLREVAACATCMSSLIQSEFLDSN